MNVAFTDLKRQYDIYAQEYESAALRVLRSGWYVLGKELEAFEKRFAEYVGARYCIGVNSGQDALILAVRALGIGEGDEVIVPSNTYIASVLGITENGAIPVFVEPDEYFNISPDKIENAITDKTKAILPVHLYGQACAMDDICDIARRHGLYIIEDCAQSHGAQYRGKMTGTFGDIGCFSFYPTKPLGALGDAGALVTDSDELEQRLRKLRNYGSGKKYVNDLEGVNTRMDELQAALLQVGLEHLEKNNAIRMDIAKRYLDGIKNSAVTLPRTRGGATNVYHVFPLMCGKRDELQRYLEENGVRTLIHYPIPPHMQKCYGRLGIERGALPIAEKYAACEISLPIYVGMPDKEIEYVIETLNRFEEGTE